MKKKLNIDCSVPVNLYKEFGQWVAHTPLLDLATSGDTLDEAKKNFSEALDIFFEECLEKGTLEKVLKSYGWKLKNKPERRFEPPEMFSSSEQIHFAA